MKNQEILNIFLDEIDQYSNGDIISVDVAKHILNLCAIGIENECTCSEQIEDILDRGKTFQSLGAYA